MPVSSLFRDLDALTQETGASSNDTPREEAVPVVDDDGYVSAEAVQELLELRKEVAQLRARVGHIKSQKRVLRSTLQIFRERHARLLQPATIPQHADAQSRNYQPRDGTTAKSVSQLHRSDEGSQTVVIPAVVSCTSLSQLQALTRSRMLHTVRRIELKWCQGIVGLDLAQYPILEELECTACPNLREVLGFARPPNLQRVVFKECDALQIIDVTGANTLVTLHLGCKNLTTIAGLGSLENLQTLILRECEQILIVAVTGLKQLADLNLQCSRLQQIQGLQSLENLRTLSVFKCHWVVSIDVSGCAELHTVRCEDCPVLHQVKGLQQLETLQKLSFTNLPVMQAIDFRGCRHLQSAHFTDCPQLSAAHGVRGLEDLRELTFVQCAYISSIDVTGCIALENLGCQRCPSLSSVRGLEDCLRLKRLILVDCHSISALDLTGLKRIEAVYLECKQLTHVRGWNEVATVRRLGLEQLNATTRPNVMRYRELEGLWCLECPHLREVVVLDESSPVGQSAPEEMSVGKTGRCSVQ